MKVKVPADVMFSVVDAPSESVCCPADKGMLTVPSAKESVSDPALWVPVTCAFSNVRLSVCWPVETVAVSLKFSASVSNPVDCVVLI